MLRWQIWGSRCLAGRVTRVGALLFSLFCASALGTTNASAQTLTTLYTFRGGDGAYPDAGLIADASGNFYGTTFYGGVDSYGTVFKLTPAETETVLYKFTDGGGGDGAKPLGDLVADASGNLYGTTESGGTNGVGTVFELVNSSGSYTEKVLHSFSGSDGEYPVAGLIADTFGNLYGTTRSGGADDAGTVFKVTPTGSVTVLYSFTGKGGDGKYPVGDLIADASGNLYGTTAYGGADAYGTVFELTAGVETVLYSFHGASDGEYPSARLIADASGNLYGTTAGGGVNGYGTVFKLTPAGAETVYSLTESVGLIPDSGLIADASGNLYGTTQEGGPAYDGTVFKLSGSGFVPPVHFEGVPGTPNCTGVSVSVLAQTYGGIAPAAAALGYSSPTALQNAVAAYCSGS